MAALEDREYQMDRLEFVKNQLNLLIADIKVKIKAISEDVASKVTDQPYECWQQNSFIFILIGFLL